MHAKGPPTYTATPFGREAITAACNRYASLHHPLHTTTSPSSPPLSTTSPFPTTSLLLSPPLPPSPPTSPSFPLLSPPLPSSPYPQYHTPRNLLLALVGEAGELAELFQWRGEGEAGPGLPGFSAQERGAVEEELADVLLYLVRGKGGGGAGGGGGEEGLEGEGRGGEEALRAGVCERLTWRCGC